MPPLIGSRITRLEDEPLLRGRGRFVDDIAMPGVWHAAFVRSPHPHALIKSRRQVARRSTLPGVHAVLTLDDLAKAMVKRRMVRHSNSGMPLDKAWAFALADGEVSATSASRWRWCWPTAATSPRTPRHWSTVDYEPLPFVADVRKAAASPPIRRELIIQCHHHLQGRVRRRRRGLRQGRVTCSSKSSGSTAAPAHSIEARGTLAEVRSADGGITVHSSTQKAHDLAQTLTTLMDFDQSLRVVAPDIGGGFGAKLCVYSEDVAVVAAAKLLDRSIKWAEDRREYFTNAVHERDQYWELEIAVDADAKVLGVRGKLLHDTGAYTLQDPNIPYNSASTMSGPYVVPGAFGRGHHRHDQQDAGVVDPRRRLSAGGLRDGAAARPGGARAEARPRRGAPAQSHSGGEDAVPEAAEDPRSGMTMQYDSGDYPACQAEVLQAAGWDEFPQRQAEARSEGRYLGIGLAHGVKGSGRGPFESGLVRISRTGRITVFTGASAMGQGLGTAMAQIAASQLGVSVDKVKVVAGDTVGRVARPRRLRQPADRDRRLLGACWRPRPSPTRPRRSPRTCWKPTRAISNLRDGAVHVAGAPQLTVKLAEIARILQGAPGYGFPAGVDPGLEASEQLPHRRAVLRQWLPRRRGRGRYRDRRGENPALRRVAGFGHSDQSDDGRGPDPRRRSRTASATRCTNGWATTTARSR